MATILEKIAAIEAEVRSFFLLLILKVPNVKYRRHLYLTPFRVEKVRECFSEP